MKTLNEIRCNATDSMISSSRAIAHTCLISLDMKGHIDLKERIDDMEKNYLIET